MPRSRTQKQVARRIDIFYFRKDSAIRNLRRALICICAIVAALWIGIGAMSHGQGKSLLDKLTLTSMHNPGHVAAPHAMFEKQCQTCHVGEKPGQYTRTVTDEACLHCHDGAIHDAHQFITDDPSKISRQTFTLAVNDLTHTPVPIRSAG
ncbi:MAG TPA: hypothetical protein VHS31_18410, partial [Tepidisphaeraceae bacterium]|nr:hypothetical protein [Tepidisphaeraceae bacterium]